MNRKPHFHFITLFPETIHVWLTTSILGRAYDAGLFSFTTYQLRDFATDKHRTVDDVAYGGGGGMVLKVEPLVAAVDHIKTSVAPKSATTVYFSPAGKPLTQRLLGDLNAKVPVDHWILVCGHYEGVDQRFVEGWVDLEISLGDFVLTGGELPALAFADATIRGLEGALGEREAAEKESFTLSHPKTGSPLLEYPHYTRPADFRGAKVPDILLSGNHGKVDQWRLEQSIGRTESSRPDLVSPLARKFGDLCPSLET